MPIGLIEQPEELRGKREEIFSSSTLSRVNYTSINLTKGHHFVLNSLFLQFIKSLLWLLPTWLLGERFNTEVQLQFTARLLARLSAC